MSKGQYRNLGNVSGAVELDCSAGNVVACTLTGNATFAVTNMVDGEPMIVVITQDGVGGRTVAWNGAGGATVQNAPAPNTGAGATTTVVLFGVDAQDQTTQTVACVSVQNGTPAGGGWADVGDYLTAQNDANTPNGISLDALAGDTVRCRVGGSTRLQLSPTQSYILSPNLASIIDCQDAGTTITNTGYVDVSGVGLGVTLNRTAQLACSQSGPALMHRTAAGVPYKWEFLSFEADTTDATVTSIVEFTTATGFVYRVWADIVCADNTNNTGGGFAPRMATFFNIGAGAVQVETTRILGPTGTIADDCLGAALRVGPVAITIDASAGLIRVRVTGVAATSVKWRGIIGIQPVPVS